MHPDTTLVSTIAISLGFALVGGFIAARLRLPTLVGYLLAGVAVGPFTPGFVADPKLAPQLAEIGVILLMFGVGTHLSMRDLWAVRGIALTGALAQIVVATAMGAGLAAFWGWPPAAGLVFGLSLSVASTVVLLRALDARGLLTSPHGRIAIGWLIVEDLAMVLVLVLLPAFAGALGGQVVADAHAAGGQGLQRDHEPAVSAERAAAPEAAVDGLLQAAHLHVHLADAAQLIGEGGVAHVEVAGVGQHGHVGGEEPDVPLQERFEAGRADLLLALDEVLDADGQLSRDLHPRLGREHVCEHLPFVVRRTAGEDLSVADGRFKRRRFPQ